MMAKAKVIIKLVNEYFGKDRAEHLYTIFETYRFFTLIYWSSKPHQLYVVKRVGASELLTVTGNEAGVTCCQELSQYLYGELIFCILTRR
jgi:hypothetical protein